MFQVLRENDLQLDVRGARAVLLRRDSRRAGPQLADCPGHGRPAGGQEDPAEDAPEAHAAAAPVREDRHAAVRGQRVRVRGQERVARVRPGRVDRVQRGPLAAGHTGRAGRHVQLPGAEDLHEIVRAAPAAAAAQRQRGRAVRQARQRHQRHDVLAEPHVGPRPAARLDGGGVRERTIGRAEKKITLKILQKKKNISNTTVKGSGNHKARWPSGSRHAMIAFFATVPITRATFPWPPPDHPTLTTTARPLTRHTLPTNQPPHRSRYLTVISTTHPRACAVHHLVVYKYWPLH